MHIYIHAHTYIPSNTHVNSGSAFVCRPEKGTVPPGRSVSVAIVWGPKLGKKNDAEVTLSIPGGTQKSFKLEGQLPENKVRREIALSSLL